MSCYAHKENTKLFVEIFNQTVEPIVGKCRLSTHLCFGNYKGRAVGLRRYDPMFPAFLEFNVDELHLEMASREFSEIEILSEISKTKEAVEDSNNYIQWSNGNELHDEMIGSGVNHFLNIEREKAYVFFEKAVKIDSTSFAAHVMLSTLSLPKSEITISHRAFIGSVT